MMSGAPPGESAGAGIILVFGLPRSGTSWLGKVFDSHPETLYLHEPDKEVHLADVPVLLSARQPSENQAIERFLAKVLANRSPAVTGKRPFFPKSYRSPRRELARNLIGLAARALPRRLCQRVRVPDLVDPGHPEPRIVWKSINSAGRLGALVHALPLSRSILIVRHPCGQIASILRGHAAGRFRNPLPSEQYRVLEALVDTEQGRAYGLTLDNLRALRPVERMAWRWALFMERALKDVAGLASCRLVRYEDLCANPVGGMRELFSFSGLDRHPQTEEFLRASTNGESADYFGVHKDPRRSARKWQDELSTEDSRRILDVVRRSSVHSLYPEDEEAARRDVAH
jgi:hypothetical protein